ncbi:hypothetical protein V6N11_071548 [Hibiscus sabdariffa]|uniref:Uncharacterized protein n=1 Tax=Hibiscus sabdariffa TaxID=183260 RepID=A0ABR2U0F6_9ROSI
MSLPSSPRGRVWMVFVSNISDQMHCERTSRDQRQGSNHSVLGGQDEVFRRVKGVLDGSKSGGEEGGITGCPCRVGCGEILPGQVVMRAMDRGRQDSLLEERGVTVWREETTLAVSREALAPAAATDGERGIKQCLRQSWTLL